MCLARDAMSPYRPQSARALPCDRSRRLVLQQTYSCKASLTALHRRHDPFANGLHSNDAEEDHQAGGIDQPPAIGEDILQAVREQIPPGGDGWRHAKPQEA